MKPWKLWMTLSVLMLASVMRASAQPQVVGQVLMAQGHVELRREQAKPQKCLGLDQLRAGDKLATGAGAHAAVVLYENGGRFALAAKSVVQVERTRVQRLSGPAPTPLKPLSQAFVRPLAHLPGPFSPKHAGDIDRPLVDPKLGPHHPWPTCAIRETNAVLHWEGPIDPEAELLRLRIKTDHEQTVTEHDLPRSQREFEIPAGILKPDCWYVWSVTPVGKNGADPACEGMVRLLSPGERAMLQREEERVEALREADPGDAAPDLLMGQVYEHLGLYEDALDAYESALRFGPNSGASAALRRLKRVEGGN
jgi:hypothetical protein